MKRRIFTLVLAFVATWGLVKAADVQVLNFASPNFTIEALSGSTVEIVKLNGVDAIKVTTSSTAGWNGIANITLNTPVKLGQYVSFKYDVNSNLDLYKNYLKLVEVGTGNAIVEGWSVENPMNVWTSSSYGLFDFQLDGAGIRKTSTFDKILLIPGLGWDANAAALDGKVAYYSNFRLEVGVDAPAKPQTPPTSFYKSNISKRYILIDGSDADDSWEIPSEQLAFSTKGQVASKGTFYSAWDAQKFYLFADITDGNKVVGYGDPGFVSWKGDGLQLYFDIYNRHFTAGVQGDQINGAALSVGMNTVIGSVDDPKLTVLQSELSGLFGPYVKGVEFGQIKGGSSYKLEIGIPWEALYYVVYKSEYKKEDPTPFAIKIANLIRTEIKAGKKVAFAAQINDNNGTDRLTTETVPETINGEGPYQQPSKWAEMELVGTGTPYFDTDYKTGGPTGTKNVIESANANVYTVLGCINVAGENLSRVEVYSVSGQRLYSSAVEADGVTILAKDYAKGIYFVKVSDTSNRTVTKKIVL